MHFTSPDTLNLLQEGELEKFGDKLTYAICKIESRILKANLS